MSRECARDIQRKLRVMNRAGAFLYFEGLSSTLMIERIYMLQGTEQNWEILFVLGGGDFVEYVGVSSWSSVRGGTYKDVVITEEIDDKYNGNL